MNRHSGGGHEDREKITVAPHPPSRRWPSAFSLAILVVGAACGDRTTPPRVDPGTEGHACYPNGTCNAGLTCASNLCVKIPDGGPVDVGRRVKPDVQIDISTPRDAEAIDAPRADVAPEPDLAVPLCPNGNIDGDEDCDGTNLNGQTCGDLGISGVSWPAPPSAGLTRLRATTAAMGTLTMQRSVTD